MATKGSSNSLPPGFPEFGVDRETLGRFFSPEISKSVFHDLVGQGKIVALDGLRGFYRLNASLVRLGLQPVRELPESREVSDRDILELALSIAAPDVVDPPPWLLGGVVKQGDAAKAILLAQRIEPNLAEISDPAERRAFVAGLRDSEWLVSERGGSILGFIGGR